jgi:hypothetical protein
MAATSARQAGRVAANDSDLEPGQRRIALVAHDGRKQDMREWAEFNRDLLTCHQLYAAETTGRMLGEELGLPATRFHYCGSPCCGTFRSPATGRPRISSSPRH